MDPLSFPQRSSGWLGAAQQEDLKIAEMLREAAQAVDHAVRQADGGRALRWGMRLRTALPIARKPCLQVPWDPE